MAITKADAVGASYGDCFHGKSATGGKIINVRVTGACKVWKTRPDEFRLPVKYGLYDSGYITQDDCDRWTKGRA